MSLFGLFQTTQAIHADHLLSQLVESRPQRSYTLENLYNILGVSPNATSDDIKKAYRSLAMRHHPDRNEHPHAESRFNAIKTAYELLSNPQKRTEYDQSINNRIILDPLKEATAMWSSLFDRCGIVLQHNDHPTH